MKSEDLLEGMIVKDDYGNTLKCVTKLKTIFKFKLLHIVKNPYGDEEVVKFDKPHLKFLNKL